MVKLNISFKDILKKHIIMRGLFKTNHNSKYSLDQIIDVIEYILITGASWRSLDLSIFNLVNIKWQSIYYHFNKFSDNKVFENVYKYLLNISKLINLAN